MADERSSASGRWKLPALMAGCFLLGLAVMYAVGGSTGRDREGVGVAGTASGAGAPVPVRDEDVARFLEAVATGDFDAMRDVGRRAFLKGMSVPNHAERFGDYATNSLPPYAVYAFFVELGKTRGRRVMLTVDADGVVDSFMAEEMKIVE